MTRDIIVRKVCSLSHIFHEQPEQAKYLAGHNCVMWYKLVCHMWTKELPQHPQVWAADALSFMNMTKQKLVGPQRNHKLVLNMDQTLVYLCIKNDAEYQRSKND